MEDQNISMVCNGHKPLCVIPINGTYILGIYKGTLSDFGRKMESNSYS